MSINCYIYLSIKNNFNLATSVVMYFLLERVFVSKSETHSATTTKLFTAQNALSIQEKESQRHK